MCVRQLCTLVTPSPTVNQPPVGWAMRLVLRSRSRNIHAFGRKTTECILPTSRSLRRALSVQYMTSVDALKSRQRGRFTAAPSPSKDIRRGGAARRIDSTSLTPAAVLEIGAQTVQRSRAGRRIGPTFGSPMGGDGPARVARDIRG
jgi:hypothetical protein